MPETNPPTNPWPQMYLVQEDYDTYDGTEPIAICPTEAIADALVSQLSADNRGHEYVVTPIPVVANAMEARLEVLTILQDLGPDGGLGEYLETRRTVWAFEDNVPAPVATTITSKGIGVFGTHHTAVRETFAAALAARDHNEE